MTRGFILVTLAVAGERSGCEYAVDCVTWLHSGCERTRTGLDLQSG